VNNKLSDEEVRWLNKRGKKLLKKYIRYKKKHRGYRGPVNWLTPIKRKKIVEKTENGKRIRYYWEFTNPPPDYMKFLQEQMEKRASGGNEGNFEVGNYGSPADYVKKYLIKNLKEIVDEGLRNREIIEGLNGELDGEGKGPPVENSVEKSELRKVWERIGEILIEHEKVGESVSSREDGEEEVELKMVDDTGGKRRKKRRGSKKGKGKSSWGSRVKFEKGKRKRLVGSIKMGWYWLTRTPFYTISPVFRIPKPKRGKSGWEFFGAWRVEDLDRLMWLERRNKMGVW
jgi:hypothetical protein